MTEDKAFLSDTKLQLKVSVLIPDQGISKKFFGERAAAKKTREKSKSLGKSCEINDKKVQTLFMLLARLKKKVGRQKPK